MANTKPWKKRFNVVVAIGIVITTISATTMCCIIYYKPWQASALEGLAKADSRAQILLPGSVCYRIYNDRHDLTAGGLCSRWEYRYSIVENGSIKCAYIFVDDNGKVSNRPEIDSFNVSGFFYPGDSHGLTSFLTLIMPLTNITIDSTDAMNIAMKQKEVTSFIWKYIYYEIGCSLYSDNWTVTSDGYAYYYSSTVIPIWGVVLFHQTLLGEGGVGVGVLVSATTGDVIYIAYD
jgi:hypothetical protein